MSQNDEASVGLDGGGGGADDGLSEVMTDEAAAQLRASITLQENSTNSPCCSTMAQAGVLPNDFSDPEVVDGPWTQNGERDERESVASYGGLCGGSGERRSVKSPPQSTTNAAGDMAEVEIGTGETEAIHGATNDIEAWTGVTGVEADAFSAVGDAVPRDRGDDVLDVADSAMRRGGDNLSAAGGRISVSHGMAMTRDAQVTLTKPILLLLKKILNHCPSRLLRLGTSTRQVSTLEHCSLQRLIVG